MSSVAYKLGYALVKRAAFEDIDASRTIRKELPGGAIQNIVEQLSDDEIAEMLRSSPDAWSRARGHGYSWGNKAKWPLALTGLLAGLLPGRTDNIIINNPSVKALLASLGAGTGYVGGRVGGSMAGHVRGLLSSDPGERVESLE